MIKDYIYSYIFISRAYRNSDAEKPYGGCRIFYFLLVVKSQILLQFILFVIATGTFAYIIVYGGGDMVILKKIIILTEYESSGASGIVKLENFAGRTSCFVRVLGVNNKAEVCIKCGEDVMYCGTLVGGVMKFGALYDLTKPIYVAVAKEGKIVCMGSNVGRFSASVLSPVLYQYYAGIEPQSVKEDKAPERVSAEIKRSEENEKNVESEKSEENKKIEDSEDSVRENFENEAVGEKKQDVVSREEKSATQQQTMTQNIKPSSSDKGKKSATTKVEEPFYKQIEASMQELFDKYENDEELMRMVPDSKWVRVTVDDTNYYVVGLIYSDGKPNLICYGIPDKDSSNPPDNANECRQWLELEKGGRGYWMMYQSAISGQTITTQII